MKTETGCSHMKTEANTARIKTENETFRMKTALTIAGSDCSGGAGIQADLKTMTVNGVYAMSVITALTAQNTTRVARIEPVTPDFLAAQLDSVFSDIFPDAVKVGMLFSAELAWITAEKLKQYEARHIVIDPVMVSTSGNSLMRSEAEKIMREKLFPMAELITPNIPEAEKLTGKDIGSAKEMEQAAAKLAAEFGCGVLLKGGHLSETADDVLCFDDKTIWLRAQRIDNPNTHGTGCTLSSAIASNLAKGAALETAVRKAKTYLTAALEQQLDLGKGNGPLDHLAGLPAF